jgi:Domain of unknown function (DUF5753)
VLARDDPPKTIVLVDELALYRQVGTADVMAGQMRHLAAAAAMPHDDSGLAGRGPSRERQWLRHRGRRRMVRARSGRLRVHRRSNGFGALHPVRYAQGRVVPGIGITDAD